MRWRGAMCVCNTCGERRHRDLPVSPMVSRWGIAFQTASRTDDPVCHTMAAVGPRPCDMPAGRRARAPSSPASYRHCHDGRLLVAAASPASRSEWRRGQQLAAWLVIDSLGLYHVLTAWRRRPSAAQSRPSAMTGSRSPWAPPAAPARRPQLCGRILLQVVPVDLRARI